MPARKKNKPLVIGHRGACGHAPENTLASIHKALEFKVDALEFDVRCCKSGDVVLMHDHTLERTTNGKGRVAAKTLAQLRKLDAGDGELIPTLEEALLAIGRKAMAIIELKDLECTEAVADIITQFVQERGFTYHDFLVVSFDHVQLKKLRSINPRILVGANIVGVPVDLAHFGDLCAAWSINAGFHHLPPELIEDAHMRGIRVFAWTVNFPDDIEDVLELDVDGIITNYPDRL